MTRHSARRQRLASLAVLAPFFLASSLSSAASSPHARNTVFPSESPAIAGSPEPTAIRVLVVYYSLTGNTEKMAKAVSQGAEKVPGATVLTKTVNDVTASDLKSADAIVLGSPTYYGDMAGPMKTFIDDWYLKHAVSLVDKVGGAFSTGKLETGGKEHVIYSLIIAMMGAGMIVAGPLEDSFGYPTPGVSALDPVNEAALKEARGLGERVAGVARRIKTGVR
jgi:NAD(P)H dehydrogenase (quinone)